MSSNIFTNITSPLSAASKKKSKAKQKQVTLPYTLKKELQRLVSLCCYNQLCTQASSMKVADQHKKLEEYFHGAGNNDPDFVSLVDKLLAGLTPFQSLFEMSSQAVITDKDTLPGSSLGNKVIRKTIHNFHDKEFEVSLLKREYICSSTCNENGNLVEGRLIKSQGQEVLKAVKKAIAHANFFVKSKSGTVNADGTYELPSGLTIDDVLAYVFVKMDEEGQEENDDEFGNEGEDESEHGSQSSASRRTYGITFNGVFAFFLFTPFMVENPNAVLECFVSNSTDLSPEVTGRKNSRIKKKQEKDIQREMDIQIERGRGVKAELELATAHLAAKHDSNLLKQKQTTLVSFHTLLGKAHTDYNKWMDYFIESKKELRQAKRVNDEDEIKYAKEDLEMAKAKMEHFEAEIQKLSTFVMELTKEISSFETHGYLQDTLAKSGNIAKKAKTGDGEADKVIEL